MAIVDAAAEFGYVADIGNVRPLVAQNKGRVRVNFGEGDGAEAGVLKADSEAADAAEQIQVREAGGACTQFVGTWLIHCFHFA